MSAGITGVPTWIYCITEDGCEETGPCKVGVAMSISKRLSSLQGGNWRSLKLAWSIQADDREMALVIESVVLGRLRPSMFGNDSRGIRRLKSEWLDASPAATFEIANTLMGFRQQEKDAA